MAEAPESSLTAPEASFPQDKLLVKPSWPGKESGGGGGLTKAPETSAVLSELRLLEGLGSLSVPGLWPGGVDCGPLPMTPDPVLTRSAAGSPQEAQSL